MDSTTNFETLRFLDMQGVLDTSCTHTIADDVLIRIYETMVKTRLVDERMITLQRQGVISFALSSLGEEACSVASAAALDLGDWLYPQYRESGAIFWRGFTIEQYVHHMFGDSCDLILGRQMPNHFGSKALNIVHVSSPIGTKIPHAAGCAYAMKVLRDEHVALCYFGEGATSEGDFHAGLNFAAVRQVPAIFFCRNNGYAISTPAWRQFASDGVAPKGIAYGIPAFRIDGNDAFAVHATVANARKHCLEGKGPVLIEAMTYRLGAHSTSDDPTLYRTSEEVTSWEERCPILRLRRFLESKNLWNESRDKELQTQLTEEFNRALDVAKKTARPALHSLVENVYFDVPAQLESEYHKLERFFPDGKPEQC